jgi:hypothetical protein
MRSKKLHRRKIETAFGFWNPQIAGELIKWTVN